MSDARELVKGKNVFISGPMTGLPHNNVTAFLEAHQLLNELGTRDVYDPAYEFYNDVAHGRKVREHEYYMRRCVNRLTCSDVYSNFKNNHWDVMVQLDGWKDSEGCMTEYEVAMACGIRVVEIGDLL